MTLRARAVAIAGLGLVVAGCAHASDGCPRGEAGTECRFERAREAGAVDPNDAGGRTDAAVGEPLGSKGVWGAIERTLLRGQAALTSGLGGTQLMNALADVCAAAPAMQPDDPGEAWTCELEPPIVLFREVLRLEVGAHGLVSLTGTKMSESRANTFFNTSKLRWAQRWCEGPVKVFDDDPDARYWRCALPETLKLVVGQFHQELDDPNADLWQVSLAIMGSR